MRAAADIEVATDGSEVRTSQASEIDARRASGALGVIRREPATSVEGIIIMSGYTDDHPWFEMVLHVVFERMVQLGIVVVVMLVRAGRSCGRQYFTVLDS